MNYEVLDVKWYTQCGDRALIGIVKIKTEEGKIKTYVGTCVKYSTTQESIDEIVSFGAKLSEE